MDTELVYAILLAAVFKKLNRVFKSVVLNITLSLSFKEVKWRKWENDV